MPAMILTYISKKHENVSSNNDVITLLISIKEQDIFVLNVVNEGKKENLH